MFCLLSYPCHPCYPWSTYLHPFVASDGLLKLHGRPDDGFAQVLVNKLSFHVLSSFLSVPSVLSVVNVFARVRCGRWLAQAPCAESRGSRSRRRTFPGTSSSRSLPVSRHAE